MHKVAAPEKVTRAVGVYEYVGDPLKPKAARLIPISLFIGGHFEDAGIYLARPVPFALDTGLRYELQKSGAVENFFDVVASRNFAGSAVAANLPFEDGWFGYGRVSAPKAVKAGRVRANCGNAHVVEEAPKDDGKPHFGGKPKAADPKAAAAAVSQECMDEQPEPKVTVEDYGRKDKDAADPERPTLHRSPESTAHNTGAEAKTDSKGKKKDTKPPAATVSQNGGPGGDDPDRPTIRHRTTDEDDPNALPPDPLELASRPPASNAAKSGPTDVRSAANETVGEGGSISGGDTMSGGPVLRRGKLTAAKDDAQAVVKPAAGASVAAAVPAPLESLVAVSDAKERPVHSFVYTFASATERAAALSSLEEMAKAVVLNPALATDAPAGDIAPPVVPVKPRAVRSTTGRPTRSRAVPAPPVLQMADEAMGAYQLYFSAPVSYTFFARVPASAVSPERYVTVVATTDPDGSLHAALRSVTDAMHLDRVPRYRPVDVVDADGSNRASLLFEVRAQRSRTFALYRLLGNRADQVFVSGSTLL